MSDLIAKLAKARVLELGQALQAGMPHFPTHPPFLRTLTKMHGEFESASGSSSAADAIAMGTHTGTHIDALNHFSCCGKLHGGVAAEAEQSWEGGLEKHSIDGVPPILRRGVLLDVAGRYGAPLPDDFEVTPAELERAAEGIEIRPGDVVLLRTGWAQYFGDARKFISEVRGPGPALAGAQWLSAHGVYAAGSDTVAFEKVPDASMPVHVHLLVESGIHIIECLNLEELAVEGVKEFLFVALPLKIRGATGSPVRPVAVG